MKTPFTSILIFCFAILVLAMVIRSTAIYAQTSVTTGDTVGGMVAQAPWAAEFRGKVVVIKSSSFNSTSTKTLTDVEMLTIGGKTIIAGTELGVRIGIAWDSVQSYHALTKEQFEKKGAKN